MAFSDWSAQIEFVERTALGEMSVGFLFQTSHPRPRTVRQTVKLSAGVPSSTWAANTARDFILALDNQEASVITPGPIIPTAPETPPTTDPRKVTWMLALRRLERWNRYKELGAIPSDNSTLTSLQSTVGAGVDAYGD